MKQLFHGGVRCVLAAKHERKQLLFTQQSHWLRHVTVPEINLQTFTHTHTRFSLFLNTLFLRELFYELLDDFSYLLHHCRKQQESFVVSCQVKKYIYSDHILLQEVL